MAKFNNKKKNNLKPSYFKENVNKFGENFLEKKNTLDFDRDSNKIIKDLVYGNINFETESKYLYNADLIEACIKRATSNYYEAYYNYMGNQQLILQGYRDQMLEYTLNYNLRRRDAYATLLNALHGFRSTGDINWLIALKGQLFKYKSNI